MTTKIRTEIRLKVNPEQSLYVQNICFANGVDCLDKSGWNSACLVMMKCNGEIIKVKDK